MSKVLVIKSSASPAQKSISSTLADVFVEKYLKSNPKDEIIYLDTNEVKMAKITLTRDNFSTFFNPEHSDAYIDQLKNVDKVIVASPMYNFNIPASLKNYLDHILVANKTFSYKYSKKGDAIGLLDHLKVQILATQGAPYGWYLWGNHVEYLKGTWEFVGAKVSEPILIDSTKLAENASLSPMQMVEKHMDKIEKLAKSF